MLRELGRLYRLHAARLARLRDRGDDPEAIRHLNALCVRAYSALYGRPAGQPNAHIPFAHQLREAIGHTWRAQLVAWILLVAGLLVGGALAAQNPEALHALLPDGMGYSPGKLDRLAASAAERARFLAADPTPLAQNLLFGSALFVHNTRIGLLAFATGMLAAVPTVLLQLYNGILLGAFASVFLRDPWPVAFLAWILPHGIPELTAISLCASGGLVLGGAVASPGRHGRSAALRIAANSALLLLAAAIPLFALAAFIESFVRQSGLSTAVRLAVAFLMAVLVATGLWYVRRAGRDAPVDTRWLSELIRKA